MNFSYQVIPFEERMTPKPVVKGTEESKSGKRPQQISRKKVQRRKSSALDKKEKISWNLTESKRYLKFLLQSQHLYAKPNKRCLKLNVRMSKAVKSRDASQCHSHHQKMLLKYGTVEEIINNLYHLRQDKISQQTQMEKVQQEEAMTTEKSIEVLALNFDFSLPPIFGEGSEGQLGDLDFIELDSYQHNLQNNWDDIL